MKKILLFFLVFTPLLHSCKVSKEYNIVVTGIPSHIEGKKAFLMLKDSINNTHIAIDSATIINGKVEIKGISTKKAALAHLLFPMQSVAPGIMLEAGKINVTLDNLNFKTGGTPLNNSWQKFNQLQENILSNELEKRALQEEANDNLPTILNIEKDYLRKEQKLTAKKVKIIRKNIKNELGAYLFINDKGSDFNPEERLKIINQLPSFWQKETVVKNMTERAKAEVATGVGKSNLEFIGDNPNGEKTSLSNIVKDNEYTLLFFWASWCPPCRRILPQIKEIHETYNEKGLEVVAISIDKPENTDTWQRAIKEEKLSWVNLIAENGWESEILKSYGIEAIPYSILVSRDGTIVSRGFPDLLLRTKLDELLKIK